MAFVNFWGWRGSTWLYGYARNLCANKFKPIASIVSNHGRHEH